MFVCVWSWNHVVWDYKSFYKYASKEFEFKVEMEVEELGIRMVDGKDDYDDDVEDDDGEN